MKKEYYEKPISEINKFKTVDVVTSSTDDNPAPFPWR